ncbi:MAG: permease-like cell division protein FtsX [Candidatus Buchananbacteria bacterium]|jgi:cell division transport system permease protein
MFIHSLSRGLLFALQSFWRNIWLSLATVFIVFLALVSVNFLLMINVITDSAVGAVKDRIDVSVYFKPEVKESKIAEAKTKLEGLSQVKEIIYKSPEENLAVFSERHANDLQIQETLKELSGNPMGATLIIKAKDLKDYPEILRYLDDPAISSLVEEKNYEDNQLIIDRINQIGVNVKKIMMIISLIFIIIAILIVFNTVRVAIFTHQNEIAIMKLVGAGNWFIRFPFVFETILAGLLAVVAAVIFLYPVLSFAQNYFNTFFAGADFNLIGYFNSNFLIIFGTELIAIIIINTISALVAISKYLNV